jgi:hypothetical protein
MKKLLIILIALLFLSACVPSNQVIQTAIARTQEAAVSPSPSPQNYETMLAQALPTLEHTLTPFPSPTVLPPTNTEIAQTPTPLKYDPCRPLVGMNYSEDTKIFVQLQAYVSQLPDVKQISYAIPERLYDNTLSRIIFISYVAEDGKTYAKRFIVYVDEFGWKPSTFSIDGQCWIDPPK